MKRVLFCLGLSAGYVLGARAGRNRYEQIKRVSVKAANSPTAQRALGYAQAGVDQVSDAAARFSRQAPSYLADAAERLDAATAPLTERVNASVKDASEQLKHLSESVTAGSRQLPNKIAHTAESLKDQLTTQLSESTERARERQAHDVLSAAAKRAALLAELEESPSDSMLDEAHADRRNLNE
ncbi:hypothetical protein [Gulosibacter bifidus]|uniref:Protoporphyrinogen oxidase n=1 Tax=Gulosibacter bifidus TaxID=272239 RepID=A0ABW5RG46_9MICO|nr:hypothetical protein [Gulosibacter bifidus]